MTNSYQPGQSRPNEESEQLRRRRTITISLITGVSFAVITAALYPVILQSSQPNFWGMYITAFVSMISFGSAILAWRRHVTTAGIILLSTVLVSSVVATIIADEQGLSIGFIAFVLGSGLSAAVLKRESVSWGVLLSMVAGVAAVILDQFIPSFGLTSEPIYTNIVAVIFGIIYLIFISRQFRTFSLRIKLVIAFTAVTLTPIIIIGAYNNYITTQTLTQDSRERMTNLSKVVAEGYDNFIIQQLSEIRSDAKQTALVDYLNLPSEQRANSLEETKVKSTLIALKRKDPIFIDSYAVLDRNGINILDTSTEYLGRDESGQSYVKTILETDTPSVSNIVFQGEDRGSIYFGAPIKDASGKVLGILRVKFHAQILQMIARDLQPDDSNINISLVDRDTYLRLAYTGNRDRLFRSYNWFSTTTLATLQKEGKLPSGTPPELFAGANPEIVVGIEHIDTTPFFDAYSDSFRANSINTGTYIEHEPWIALVRESDEANLTTIRDQTRNTIFISLALAGIAILLAFGAAQVLAEPIVSLTRVAEKISTGDITARATVNTEDEIGALSSSFNRMTDELNHTLSNLELRVVERTTDLEMARQQSEIRAGELQTIGEISRIISSERRLEILLPLVTRLVSERFNFYHAGIFLLDATRQFAILQAANSEGGQRMLARGHKLAVGESGIVGYVTDTGNPRIALDVGQDAVFFNNPDLPSTRSEMALPLKVRGEIAGALDVQSEKPGAFTQNDVETLSILADQIAIAIENARLFVQTQEALNEAQNLYRQYMREGWTNFNRDEALIGYRYSLHGGQKINTPLETDEIRDALNRGTTIVSQTGRDQKDPYMVIPIKLRGQVIGTLRVQSPTSDRPWSNDEINLAETISERLSIALENARLIQESQRQVIKEQTISDVTSKIGASIDLKNILRTAVEELGRSIPGSDVIIRLNPEDGDRS